MTVSLPVFIPLFILVAVAIAAGARYVIRSMREAPEPTVGRRITASEPLSTAERASTKLHVFSGGVNLDREWWTRTRFNAGLLFGLLTVKDGRATLRSIFFSVMPSAELDYTDTKVFLARGMGIQAVGFRDPTGSHYFGSFRPQRVLNVLRANNFRVGDDEWVTMKELSGSSNRRPPFRGI